LSKQRRVRRGRGASGRWQQKCCNEDGPKGGSAPSKGAQTKVPEAAGCALLGPDWDDRVGLLLDLLLDLFDLVELAGFAISDSQAE